MNKFWTIVIASLIIIAGIILLAKISVNKPGVAPQSSTVNKVTDIPFDVFPREFPQNIPIEKGAQIVSNYNATSPEGALQATRVFASEKTVADNFDFYKKWLTQNDWKVISEINDPTQPESKTLVGLNDSGIINISIQKSITGAVSVVDISFVVNRSSGQ